jgi:hypothetical protein
MNIVRIGNKCLENLIFMTFEFLKNIQNYEK